MVTERKVLIIDDEVDLTQLIAFQFESRGFVVETAFDGLQALKKMHHFEPDLIILDINMPRMGGIEFYSKVCDANGKPLYPILVLTARANIEGLFKDLTIDGFIVKPFEVDHLIEEASQIIIRKSNQQKLIKYALKQRNLKVCLVDNDPESFGRISSLLLMNDITVIPAFSGAVGIERMVRDVPDVALVSLGLRDLPGDTVIFRLSQMAKTMDVKFILYTSRTVEHDARVMERISYKTGIYTFVEYNVIQELVDATKNIIL